MTQTEAVKAQLIMPPKAKAATEPTFPFATITKWYTPFETWMLDAALDQLGSAAARAIVVSDGSKKAIFRPQNEITLLAEED